MILDGFEIENGWTWLKELGTEKKQLHGIKIWGKKYIKPLVYVNRWVEGYLFMHTEAVYDYDYDGSRYKEGVHERIYLLSKKPRKCLNEDHQPDGIVKEWSAGSFVNEYAGGIPQETKGWKNPEYCEILLSVVKEKK